MHRAQRAALLLLSLLVRVAAGADEYEQPPIEYSRSVAENPVSDLEAAVRRGEVELRRDARQGYLRDLLARLAIRAESQILVFSKTSLQRDRISPRAPRAIYFNDDVYVGYCRAGNVLEIAAADPHLGMAFYTLDQTAERARPSCGKPIVACCATAARAAMTFPAWSRDRHWWRLTVCRS